MELHISETISDTTNSSTNNELSLSFDIANGGTETVYVDDKLLTNYDVAKARAESIFLDEGYVTKRVTFSTYHIDNLHIGDTIQLDGLLFKVINIVDKIKGAVVSMDITAERADAPIRDITIINWWDLSGVKHTIESDLDTALVGTFQSRTDATKVEIVAIKSTCTSMENFMTNVTICTEFICSASTKNITDFGEAWYGCSSLTSFPHINTSSGTSFGGAWGACSSLTSFPLIDTSSGTDFAGAWSGCSSLTSFPLIDTSSGTYFGDAWSGCSSLTSFPLIDTSSGTYFTGAWNNCPSLTSFPLIDTSSGTDFGYTWGDCPSLTSFPLIDTSSGTDFAGAWYGCSSLTSFPHINTSSGTDFGEAWYGCQLPTLQCVPDGECGYCVMTFDDGVEVPSGDTRYVCF